MKKLFVRLCLLGSLFLTAGSTASADIIISISFDQNSLVGSSSIAQGTATLDVFLHFDAIDGMRGNDAGEFFDGFTYAIEANNTTEALRLAEFAKPVTSANLSALLQTQGWNVVDQSGLAAENQVGGNVNAPGGSGLVAPFGATVLGLTVDTSQLVALDEVTFDPNLFDTAAVSNGLNDFGGNSNYVFNQGRLIVTAVPEPSGMAVVLLIGLATGLRRKKRV